MNKLTLEYEYQGKQHVKNIKKPVKIYRVRMDPECTIDMICEEKPRTRRGLWVGVVVLGALLITVGTFSIRYFNKKSTMPALEISSEEKMAFPLSEKPSIAVLPFVNMSGDPAQEYLADGISENIITALSIIPEMFVISRNSTFTYKGKPIKVQQVSEELGVKYVLEGSVQKSTDRIRVTAQLIDATTGHHLWAERYDQDLTNLFDLQDEITLKILRLGA